MERVPAFSVSVKAARRSLTKAVWLVLGILILLIGTLLGLPAFVDLGIFKGTYLPLVEDVLHRRIDVG